mmetsp:Transcript_1291/g.2856  ORF Transcript_1291/g.2856 Transcript_1291/m.2856 type:complete len:244 (+) Transcript_1291:1153-1884(+)
MIITYRPSSVAKSIRPSVMLRSICPEAGMANTRWSPWNLFWLIMSRPYCLSALQKPSATASSEQHQRRLPSASEAPTPSSVQSHPSLDRAHSSGTWKTTMSTVDPPPNPWSRRRLLPPPSSGASIGSGAGTDSAGTGSSALGTVGAGLTGAGVCTGAGVTGAGVTGACVGAADTGAGVSTGGGGGLMSSSLPPSSSSSSSAAAKSSSSRPWASPPPTPPYESSAMKVRPDTSTKPGATKYPSE